METCKPGPGTLPHRGRGRDPNGCLCLLLVFGTQLGQYGCPILLLYARNMHREQDGRYIFVANCIINIAATKRPTTHYFTIMTEFVQLCPKWPASDIGFDGPAIRGM